MNNEIDAIRLRNFARANYRIKGSKFKRKFISSSIELIYIIQNETSCVGCNCIAQFG